MFTWKFKMAAIFVKLYMVFTDPQIYRSFESIKNLQRFDFFKVICNSKGECAP